MMVKLGIVVNGARVSKFSLEPGAEVVLGRNPKHKNSVRIDESKLSGEHAQLMLDKQNQLYIVDLESTNGSFINDQKITPNQAYKIGPSDKVSFVVGHDIKLVFDPDSYESKPRPLARNESPQETDIMAKFARQNVVTLGRSSSCDVVLEHQTISKQHAQIERKANGRFYLKDLGSLNGTYLNGHRISNEQEVTEKDYILIGRYAIRLKGGTRNLSDEVTVRAERIVKEYANGYQGLKQASFDIPSGVLMAVMGPSGCGKSTLLKALCGDSPVTNGAVYLFGMELHSNYDFLKTQIGYVPQDDIVHRELTVDQSLYYAAKLRLPNATNEQISQKINQVLSELNITHIRNSLVKKISGGQRKRVSIAVEILTDPMVLFLDEPTSPLDPQTISEFLGILRNLAERGTTVIMVTHKPGDLEFMDSVIFMTDGNLVYDGDASGFQSYFGVKSIREVYEQLAENPKFWIDKRSSEYANSTSSKSPVIKHSGKVNFFHQFRWLTQRYFNIKLNDRLNSLIMVGQAPIIALLVCLIFQNVTQAVPFLMAISAIWFGANNAAREIVCELPIYKRERMFNQGIFPYVFSKITVLGAFAAVQSLLFTLIISVFYTESSEVSVAWTDPLMTFFWMLFVSIAASLMGLFLSSVVDTSEKVMTLVPIALIPQIMLAGVVAVIQNSFVEILSYFTLARWGTEGFSIIQQKVCTETLSVELKEGTGILDDSKLPPKFIDPIFEINPKDTIINAGENLKEMFHSSYDKFGELQGTLKLDAIAIGLLALVFFVGIYISLKRKDPIKIR